MQDTSALVFTSYKFPLGAHSSIGLGLHIHARVGGNGPFQFMVDTGSTGLVISACDLRGATYHTTGKPFALVYSSSGRRYEGEWVYTRVTFLSPLDPTITITTHDMLIRMVERYQASDTSPWDNHPSVYMLGVGFDRDSSGKDPDGNDIPTHINPFLLLDNPLLKQGYILNVRDRCIELGITTMNTEGFEFVNLLPSPNRPGDFLAPTVGVDVPNADLSTPNLSLSQVSLLMDSGLNIAIVQAQYGQRPKLDEHHTILAGQKVVISAPWLSKPLYTFTVGDESTKGKMPPDSVEWYQQPISFINTSRHTLAGFDYLFHACSAEKGQLGFRFRSELLPSYAQTPPLDNFKSYKIALDPFSSLANGLYIRTNIGNSDPFGFMIDTGSTGIVVGEVDLQPSDYKRTGKPFELTYTSSGRVYQGEWVIATVTFSSPLGFEPPIEVSTNPILIRLCKWYRANSHAGWETNHSVHMLGVGFDRDTGNPIDPAGYPIPPFLQINPFLAIEEMTKGIMQPGFILNMQESYVELGITPTNTSDFTLIELKPRPGRNGDYVAPTVSVTLPSANIHIPTVSLLMDSGLGRAIIEAPFGMAPPLDPPKKVKVGEEIVVSLPGCSKPLYAFTVVDKTKDPSTNAPDTVTWLQRKQNFINTSRHALSGFDYLLDTSDEKQSRLGIRFGEYA